MGADNRNLAGHSFCRCIRPAGPRLAADKDIRLRIEPGHPALGQIEMEFMRNPCPNQRTGVFSLGPHQTVKKNEPELRKFFIKPLNGTDDTLDSLSSSINPAVTEDPEFIPFLFLLYRIKNPGIHPARKPVAENFVFLLQAVAHPLRISQKNIAPLGNLFFLFVSFKHKIEKFYPGLQLIEIGQDRIFAAKPDVKVLLSQRRKGLCASLEVEPIRLCSLWMEKDKGMAPFGQFVPNFKIAPDAAEDFDVRKNCRNFHQND